MKRIHRLVYLIIISLIAGAITLLLANFYITSIKEDAAKATIVAGVITLFGTIFSALYKEISTYYQERSESIKRKWDLIFPFIKKHYNPWINSAKSFRLALNTLDPNALNDEVVIRVLYLTSVFFGIRLRFIIKDGGLILLSSHAEEKKVEDAYRQIENTFGWAKDETPRRVSYLQNLFLSKEKPKNPYVLAMFMTDLTSDNMLKKSKENLHSWLTIDNIENLKKALDNFISCFQASLDKLYTAWSD